MLFNSLQFCIFFPLVTAGYFLLPQRLRWFWLLCASCLFYMAFIPVYILVLAATIIVDYTAAIYIARSSGRRRKIFLVISLGVTLAILFVFKYFNFFNANLAQLARWLHWNYPVTTLSLILPIGLSFHTFQSMSYVIEVYRTRQAVERNFGVYALYVMFYPQLVAGPIERPYNLLHQFYEHHTFDYRRVTEGLKLMAWGMCKKVVIADRLAFFVNQVYNDPSGFQGISLISATVFFAFQIYCDFSGYSDIAIGAAQVMGFKLMENFRRPYFAQSVSEFWRRWHISLSSWFRDYLYIPLGGSRVATLTCYRNILITFLLSGLWHGANWTFVIWGALNGAYVIGEQLIAPWRLKVAHWLRLDRVPLLYKAGKIAVTFSLVCFSWIFFRAKNMADASYIVTHLFSGVPEFLRNLAGGLTTLGTGKGLLRPVILYQTKTEFVIVVAAILVMELLHLLQRRGSLRQMVAQQPVWVRWPLYYVGVLLVMVLGKFNHTQFIYFQF